MNIDDVIISLDHGILPDPKEIKAWISTARKYANVLHDEDAIEEWTTKADYLQSWKDRYLPDTINQEIIKYAETMIERYQQEGNAQEIKRWTILRDYYMQTIIDQMMVPKIDKRTKKYKREQALAMWGTR
jgi:hypothetical protein